MKRFAIVLLAATCLPGCRWLAHSIEREEIEERVVSEVVLGEEWKGRASIRVEAEGSAKGAVVRAWGVERGVRRVKSTEEVRVTVKCARRSVGGIFEAPDSVVAVADDIWVGTAFLGHFLFHHVETGDSRVAGALFVLGGGQIAVDALFFIPWFIAGHDWSGPCDYVSSVRNEGAITEEKEREVTREVPLASGVVEVRRGGEVVGTLAMGAEGQVVVPARSLIEWVKGRGDALTVVVSDGEWKAEEEIRVGRVLAEPAADWSVKAGGAEPAVRVTEILTRGNLLVIRLRNEGKGDAWQVAAIVASEDAGADGMVAPVGRMKPGEHVEVQIVLPRGSMTGALDFSEAFGRAPAAIPFGN